MTEKKVISRNKPCDAVLLLMQRMDSHPGEFNLNTGKWANLFGHVKERVVDGNKNRLVILSDGECDMLWGKFIKAGQKQLHSFVMQKILEGNGEKDE